ncbi:MAG: hypothetical protein WD076_01275, partial [Parvularculaceae bacterium]
ALKPAKSLMFVGHYGPAAAVAHRRLRLWHCFVAVQLLDILWAPLVLLGVEKVRITPHYTASNHFDLYYMPFSHSLVMAVFWSIAATVVYYVLRRGAGWIGAAVIGALVFSHWALDFLMHKPDLALWFGGPKVGLALWDHRPISFGLEMGLFILGMGVYWTQSAARNFLGRILPAFVIVLGIAAQVFGNWGPPPASASEAALSAIVAYAIFAGFAATIDATRAPRPVIS